MDAADLNIGRDGAELFRAALGAEILSRIEEAVARLPRERAGIRLRGIPVLKALLADAGAVSSIVAAVLGEVALPVRAILFDKTATANWALGWHQDRTIAVTARMEVPGFDPWTIKDGLVHVAPPYDVLARMVTLRVHLDPVTASNAPLLIAPGSHRLGRISAPEVPEVVRRCGSVACLADIGDVWLYSTPILHASHAAVVPTRRRVLQVDFAVGRLPGGLQWQGI